MEEFKDEGLPFTPEDYEEIAEQRRAAYGGLLEWSEIIAVYAAKELKARGFILTPEQEKLAAYDMPYLAPDQKPKEWGKGVT